MMISSVPITSASHDGQPFPEDSPEKTEAVHQRAGREELLLLRGEVADRNAVPRSVRRGDMSSLGQTVVLLLLSGCAGATGNVSATDPTERGLSYVAAAIVTAAVIRALFNK